MAVQQAQAAQWQKYELEQSLKEESDRALAAAWDSYLTASRSKFKQIDVIRDTVRGDYVCLRRVYGSLALAQPHSYLVDGPEKKAREQMINAWTYELQDRLADGFVQWLNRAKTLDRIDWRYDHLKQMTGETSITLDDWTRCLSPNNVWRANRFQRRID